MDKKKGTHKKEILAQEEVDYAWHWIPVHIKDFLNVKQLFFIHAKPEDMWFTSFLTQIKNITYRRAIHPRFGGSLLYELGHAFGASIHRGYNQ